MTECINENWDYLDKLVARMKKVNPDWEYTITKVPDSVSYKLTVKWS